MTWSNQPTLNQNEKETMWNKLTQPHSLVTDIEQRRRAQFLAACLLFLNPVAILGLLGANIITPPASETGKLTVFIMLIVVMILVGIYFISRTKYYSLGASAVITILFAGSVGLSIYDSKDALTLIPYLSLVSLITSLLFSYRATTYITIITNIAGIISLFVPDQTLSSSDQDIIVFNLIMGVLIVAAAFIRTQYIEQIELQTTQLDIARATLEQRVEQRTRQLKEANEELRRFAYILSHDLRNHLVNFSGFTEELYESVEVVRNHMNHPDTRMSNDNDSIIVEALNEDIPSFLSIIDTSVGQMKRMVDAMLELARLENRPLKLESLKMNDLLAEILASLSTEIKTNDVNIKLQSLPDVVADRFAMERIFTNLIHNAVIYSNTSRSSEIIIGGQSLQDEAIFFVQDNGIGINEEDLHLVFDIFKRVGVKDVDGDGMGLAFVRNLIQRHGGTVKCESIEGLGSKFTITIKPDSHTENGGLHDDKNK